MGDLRGYMVAIEDFVARYGALPPLTTVSGSITLAGYTGVDLSSYASTNPKWGLGFASNVATVSFTTAAASPIRSTNFTVTPKAGGSINENVDWAIAAGTSNGTPAQFLPRLEK
ncbi:MAG: hypothetical protein ACPGYX_05815 [Oceanobacter sp.]